MLANQMLRLGGRNSVQVTAPLQQTTKHAIGGMAKNLGLVLGDYVSCYQGYGECGECGACRGRLKAWEGYVAGAGTEPVIS